jgi:hypothetical protein
MKFISVCYQRLMEMVVGDDDSPTRWTVILGLVPRIYCRVHGI